MSDMTNAELGIKEEEYTGGGSREPGTGGFKEMGIKVDDKGLLRRTKGGVETLTPDSKVAHYTEAIHRRMYFDPAWVTGLGLVDNIPGSPMVGLPDTKLSLILSSAFQGALTQATSERISRATEQIVVNSPADQERKNRAERILYGAILPAIELSQIQNIGRFASLHEYLQQHPQVEPTAIALLLNMDQSARRSFGYFMKLAGRDVASDGTFNYTPFRVGTIEFSDLDPRVARKESVANPATGKVEIKTVGRDPYADNVTRDGYLEEVAGRVGCSLGPTVVAYELFRLFQPHMHAGWTNVREWVNAEKKISGQDLERETASLLDSPFNSLLKTPALDGLLISSMANVGIAGPNGFADALTHLMQNAFMRRHECLSLVYSALDAMRDIRAAVGSKIDIPFADRPKAIRAELDKAGDKSALDKNKIVPLSQAEHIEDKLPQRQSIIETEKAGWKYWGGVAKQILGKK